jgi:hypothetical protein
MNGYRPGSPPGPPWGPVPPFRRPFGPRMAADLVDNQTYPPITPEDLQQLAMMGLLPPETWASPDVDEMGRESAKVLESDFRMGAAMPETGEEVVRRRGLVGDSFRGLQPLNLGRGAVCDAGDTRVLIVEARGLDSLTPVGIMLGFDVPEGEASLANTTDLFIQAEIEWGVGGAQHHAVVDVGRGTQLRLAAASYVKVFYNYTPDQSTTPPRTGPPITGIGLLGYGTPSFRPSPARFTQRVKSVPAVASAPTNVSSVIEIPKFASSYGVVGETASIAGWSAQLLPALVNDGNGHSVFQPLADNLDESQLEIPNGMTAIQLTNGSSTAQKVNIVFTIML